jgi:hypothetical protein
MIIKYGSSERNEQLKRRARGFANGALSHYDNGSYEVAGRLSRKAVECIALIEWDFVKPTGE